MWNNRDHPSGLRSRLQATTLLARSAALAAILLPLLWQGSQAGPLRDRIAKASPVPVSLQGSIRIERDIPYGDDPQQRFDVYIPSRARHAPVIFMVHGGAWSLGDKAAGAVVENKVARWLPRGFIVVSANYRLLPKAGPLEQAKDVARALAAAQAKADSWGGDRTRFILMGHSAGAHLVALLATAPALSSGIVSTPWLGAVSLDSAALDVVRIMGARHAPFYDRAFGVDSEYWKAASPFHAVAGPGQPMLMVCSSPREDSCPQTREFVAKAASQGTRVTMLERDLSHGELNQRLGEEEGYTQAVEAFMASLDESVAGMLANRGQ